MNSQTYFWIFISICSILLLQSIKANINVREKRQWGFGYPLFGGLGNSWEVPSNLPTYWGYNAMAGR
ncbi:uncharacterized protein CELE_F12A10.1 [Caenorhabditis elegans]|uniref:Uncharacterized protein n=1 Tax=Caenorhabditis elegans TaxID=6239 RepID=B3WFT6_CAEEL|nr:Uncharacterized protein CELE_F12A10.1 [Caenorhabditis elegans]CCD69297.1 Uncharacterized protein CELE_F12A10.1 [Caenorhabditis elegans]|eukprot:NP_495048.3 Uncharacterized protein CELE_F12A10.1 [Caenorhabditis elegans]